MDTTVSEVTIRLADWGRDAEALRLIRTRVFIEEQRIPKELEWDELDERCVHALAVAGDTPVGTGRLTPDGYIGRMAVLPEWRGQGVGDRLLRTLMDVARERGDKVCRLHAQISAMGFYERLGFQAEGEEFMDAGIPHRTMSLRLEARAPTETFDGHEAVGTALFDLARTARLEFALYAPDLAPRLTDRPDLAEALRALALSNPRARIRLLCRDAREAARGGHALLRLSAALPSRCALRELDPQDETAEELYAFADQRAVLHQPRRTEPRAHLQLNAPRRAREFSRHFEQLWERSKPAREARRLEL